MDIDELVQRAVEYVELEAHTTVTSAKFVQKFSLLGREDVVISVETTDKTDPNWWVVGGDTPMNLYTKNKFGSADEAFSFHSGIMLRMMSRDFETSTIPPDGVGYDAFISHASEDKDSLVRPLARLLNKMGFYIWYDEFELKIGDSLRQSIDKGLINSNYGIVVLSKSFFAKNWPQYELNGLTAKEIEGEKVILPIWHGVKKEDVLLYSPTLADKVAVDSSRMDIKSMARELAKVLGSHDEE